MQLNQQQIEALVKLMIMAEYQDNRLSHVETQDFKKRIEDFSWKSPIGMSIFINTAISEIRDATSNEAVKVEFLKNQAGVFETDESRKFVLDQISDLVKSDGVEQVESSFLLQLRSCLGI